MGIARIHSVRMGKAGSLEAWLLCEPTRGTAMPFAGAQPKESQPRKIGLQIAAIYAEISVAVSPGRHLWSTLPKRHLSVAFRQPLEGIIHKGYKCILLPDCTMATVVQFGKQAKLVGIDPDLKAFIDRVIVPILVKDYLDMAEADEAENVLAEEDSIAANLSAARPYLRLDRGT